MQKAPKPKRNLHKTCQVNKCCSELEAQKAQKKKKRKGGDPLRTTWRRAGGGMGGENGNRWEISLQSRATPRPTIFGGPDGRTGKRMMRNTNLEGVDPPHG